MLLTKVLPVFDQVYAGLGGQLTGVAGGLLALGRVLDRGMPVLCLLLAAVGCFWLLFSLSGLPPALGIWWRHGRFGDRGVSRKIDDGRFAQALSMGMASGLPLEEALTQAAGLLEDSPSAQARCRDCLERLDREGGAGPGGAPVRSAAPGGVPAAGPGAAQRLRRPGDGGHRPPLRSGRGGRPGGPGQPGGARLSGRDLCAGGAHPPVGDAAPDAHHVRHRVSGHGNETRKRRAVLSLLGGLAAACCALAIFFDGLGNLDPDSGERSRRQLEETLRRAAVACYAAQGAYPRT
ncbi:MAG: hypothetical protein V8S34_06345 [Lawsonibacter sp.]